MEDEANKLQKLSGMVSLRDDKYWKEMDPKVKRTERSHLRPEDDVTIIQRSLV